MVSFTCPVIMGFYLDCLYILCFLIFIDSFGIGLSNDLSVVFFKLTAFVYIHFFFYMKRFCVMFKWGPQGPKKPITTQGRATPIKSFLMMSSMPTKELSPYMPIHYPRNFSPLCEMNFPIYFLFIA